MNKLNLLVCLFISSLAYSQDISFHKIPSREGVTQGFLYSAPAQPFASAVLFQGGSGSIGASGTKEKGWARRDEGFLSGGATRFVSNGITAAVIDNPSDRGDLNNGFRSSVEHSRDIATVISFLRQQSPLNPVCLIGTSNGSLSAASGAAFLGEQGPDCIVLTSSTNIKPESSIVQKYAHVFTDADLAKIKVPVLILHHKYDKCKHTPFEPMAGYISAFKNSPKVDFTAVEGGQDHGDSCNRGYHQFLGIESQVTQQIAEWIKSLKITR